VGGRNGRERRRGGYWRRKKRSRFTKRLRKREEREKN
jgi:hypothetical protein